MPNFSSPESPGPTPWFALPFQRVTSRGDHIREIDGLRFMAVALILLLHLHHYVSLDSRPPFQGTDATPLGIFLENSSFGVQIFFAISGFILALPFARHWLLGAPPIRLKSYYLRRLTRLEPPLLINLTMILLLMTLVLGRPLSELWSHFLATCFYLHTLIYKEVSVINSVTWSLEVEAKFYLTMPLWAMVFRVRSFTWRQVIFTVMIVATALQPWVRQRGSLLPELPYFVVGFMLADIWISRWKERPGHTREWDLLAVAGSVALVAALYWKHAIAGSMALVPFLLLVVMVSAVRGTLVSAFLRHWLPVTIGGMCYTIYLYHLIVYSALTPVLARWIRFEGFLPTLLVQLLLQIPVVLAICAFFFILFERPFMKWNPFSRQRRQVKAQGIEHALEPTLKSLTKPGL